MVLYGFKTVITKKKFNSKIKLWKGSKFPFYNATKIPIFHFRCELSHIGFHKVRMCVLFRFFPSQMRWMPPPIHNDPWHWKEIRLYSLGEKATSFTNQFLITCHPWLSINYKIIFILKNSMGMAWHLKQNELFTNFGKSIIVAINGD